MINKNSWSLYILCYFIVLMPIYLVWSKFPEIMSNSQEKVEHQVVKLSLIGALPFLFILILCIRK